MKLINHVNINNIPHLSLNKGMFLEVCLIVDSIVRITNVHKITNIQKNGVIRIQCIDHKCTKKNCTYLNLYDFEINKLKINNKIKKSKRINVFFTN